MLRIRQLLRCGLTFALRRAAPVALLLAAPLASASQFYGVGPNCKFQTIQAAINALVANDHVFDPAIYLTTIAVAGNTTFSETLNIDSSGISWPSNPIPYQGAVLQIVGGYDQTCDQPDPAAPAGSTVIDAHGKSGSAVFIHGSGFSYVILSNLTLANANNTSGNATGGGINFTGAGRLDIFSATVYNNEANFGGGIYANGSGSGILLTLGSGTTIQNNLARKGGGGIRLDGATHLLALEPSIYIFDNTADPNNTSDGTGGGIQIFGLSAVADIGSPGLNGSAVVDSNHARVGGGIAVQGGGGLRLFSTVGGLPATLSGNGASLSAALYVDDAWACGSGYAINGNIGPATTIGAINNAVVLMTESALAASSALSASCGHSYPLPPHSACPIGTPCNQIDDNDGTFGFTISVANALFVADRFELRRNHQAEAVFSSGSTTLSDCLLADNGFSEAVIDNNNTAGAGDITINGCTIANNPTSQVVFNAGHSVTLANSILALNGNGAVSVQKVSGSVFATDVIAPETASLINNVSSNINAFDPGFVDADNRDYHLRPGSAAIDYHLAANLALPSVGTDLDGRPRGIPLGGSGNSAFDIGAYELQSLPPCAETDKIFCSGFESP